MTRQRPPSLTTNRLAPRRPVRASLTGLAASVGIALLAALGPAPAWADSAPNITKQPEIAFVTDPDPGQVASFTAAADGTPTPTVQWEQAPDRGGPWTEIPGATAPTLHFDPGSQDLATRSARTSTTRPATRSRGRRSSSRPQAGCTTSEAISPTCP